MKRPSADVSRRDKSGKTARASAELVGQAAVTALLRDAEAGKD